MKLFHFLKTSYLLLAMMMVFISCKKDEEDPAPAANTGPSVACQFKATLDGTTKDFKFTTAATEIYECAVGSDGSIGDGQGGLTNTSEFIYQASMFDPNTDETFTINIGTLELITGGYPDNATFHAFFSSGAKSYSDDAANGIQITHYDVNGVSWTTNGIQSGSAFNFTSMEKTEILGNAVVNFTATFNCTLYDGLGNSKTLTNGTAILSFENI